MIVDTPLTLPCGSTLNNRIVKAAMTEGLADNSDRPTQSLNNLYRRWSAGGAGLLLTGNIMVDRRYLERGGNMVLEDDRHLGDYIELAKAGKTNGNAFWAQLNHPGRQCTRLVNSEPIGPSDIQLKLGGNYARPRAMTESDIENVIARFTTSAALVQQAGFDGVQIHSAHGYLLSQFLSPLSNQRQDQWGGTLENRTRLLLAIVRSVRERVGTSFPISVKLNSADFQQGGFELEDCQHVAHCLGEEDIDLLEISGGTYESLIWMDNSEKRDGTLQREAFFLQYAEAIRKHTSTPMMITGGFRHLATMEHALATVTTDMIGIARPFCIDPDFPKKLFLQSIAEVPQGEQGLVLGKGWLGPRSPFKMIRAINNQGQVSWFYRQIVRLALGKNAMEKKSVLGSFIKHMLNEIKISRRRAK
jgi:2,4-dienoyl-CoA reductase-like NADH-dependent reductase (Old Yellow Enzyme family)